MRQHRFTDYFSSRFSCFYKARPMAAALLRAAAACTAAVSLAACTAAGSGSGGPGAGNSAAGAVDMQGMQLGEFPLTDEMRELVSLVDTHSSSRIFQYKMDENMKELHFFIEEFKDGKLTCLTSAWGPTAESGRFAVLFDPDEVTLSWDGGKYSCLIDSTAGYLSSISSQLSGLSSMPYNEKEAVAMIACTKTNFIETADVTMYSDLLGLKERNYDRVLFVTVAFTDFTVKDELVSYHGTVRDRADLSADTVQWLERYNSMDVAEQLALSYVPVEFINRTGEDVRALETDAAAAEPKE